MDTPSLFLFLCRRSTSSPRASVLLQPCWFSSRDQYKKHVFLRILAQPKYRIYQWLRWYVGLHSSSLFSISIVLDTGHKEEYCLLEPVKTQHFISVYPKLKRCSKLFIHFWEHLNKALCTSLCFIISDTVVANEPMLPPLTKLSLKSKNQATKRYTYSIHSINIF